MGGSNSNHAPIADAGKDQKLYAGLDGVATVTLNGCKSKDKDKDPLSYTWYWMSGKELMSASGVKPRIPLAPGKYVISLVVNDGQQDSKPDYVKVDVVAPLGCRIIAPYSITPRTPEQIAISLLLPEGIRPSEVNTKFGITTSLDCKIRAESVKVISVNGRTLVISIFRKSAIVRNLPPDLKIPLRIGGQLKSGSWFCANHSLIIKPPVGR